MSCNQSSFTKACKAGENFVSSFAPDERFGLFVVVVEVNANRGFQLACAAKYTATNLFFCEKGKPTFDKVEPESACGRKVQVKSVAV